MLLRIELVSDSERLKRLDDLGVKHSSGRIWLADLDELKSPP